MLDFNTALSIPLRGWVRWVRLHALLTLASCVFVTLASGFYAGTNLGINSDTIQLFPEHQPTLELLGE